MDMAQGGFFVNNKTLIERRDRLLGKGAALFYREPVHIVKGEGVWLYDAEGARGRATVVAVVLGPWRGVENQNPDQECVRDSAACARCPSVLYRRAGLRPGSLSRCVPAWDSGPPYAYVCERFGNVSASGSAPRPDRVSRAPPLRRR